MNPSRILVTESQAEYPRQLIQVLTTHNDVIVYTIAKNAVELSLLLAEYQTTLTVVPILLDVDKNEKDTRLLMKHLPKLDTIINFHGAAIIEKIPPKSYKLEEVTIHPHSKVEKVLNRLLSNSGKVGRSNEDGTSKNQTYVIDITYSNGANRPHTPVTQQPSATTVARQVTNTLRSSFRKLFRKTQSLPFEQSGPASAGSSNMNGSGPRRSNTMPSPGSPLSPSARLAILNWNQPDFKLNKKLHKLFKEYEKKWKAKEKKFVQWEKKQHKILNQSMIKYKKDEEVNMKQSNAEANAATFARAHIISPGTADEIVKRRDAWAQKKVDRKTDAKFQNDKLALQGTIRKEKDAWIEKHYDKIFTKQLEVLEKYI